MNKQSLKKKIISDPSIKECFDCGSKEDMTYISYNNAVFLCGKCGIFHMKNLKNCSDIIINNLDILSKEQLLYLSEGGNSALMKFIIREFPKLKYLNPLDFYKTNAMLYYRRKVKEIFLFLVGRICWSLCRTEYKTKSIKCIYNSRRIPGDIILWRS